MNGFIKEEELALNGKNFQERRYGSNCCTKAYMKSVLALLYPGYFGENRSLDGYGSIWESLPSTTNLPFGGQFTNARGHTAPLFNRPFERDSMQIPLHYMGSMPIQKLGLCYELVLCVNPDLGEATFNQMWKFILFGKFMDPVPRFKCSQQNMFLEGDMFFVPLCMDNTILAKPVGHSSPAICQFLQRIHTDSSYGSGSVMGSIANQLCGEPDFSVENALLDTV